MPTAAEILAERLAKGEIDEATYDRLMAKVRQASGPAPPAEATPSPVVAEEELIAREKKRGSSWIVFWVSSVFSVVFWMIAYSNPDRLLSKEPVPSIAMLLEVFCIYSIPFSLLSVHANRESAPPSSKETAPPPPLPKWLLDSTTPEKEP